MKNKFFTRQICACGPKFAGIGKGIGRQLLNAILDYSKEAGLAGVVLYTSEYAPAFKFYEKNGFKLSQGTICMYCE